MWKRRAADPLSDPAEARRPTWRCSTTASSPTWPIASSSSARPSAGRCARTRGESAHPVAERDVETFDEDQQIQLPVAIHVDHLDVVSSPSAEEPAQNGELHRIAAPGRARRSQREAGERTKHR